MNQLVINTKIKKGTISIKDIPLSDNTDVQVVVIPKIILDNLSFKKIRELTKTIKGNISEEISQDRIQ